jgi:hypothetical protein
MQGPDLMAHPSYIHIHGVKPDKEIQFNEGTRLTEGAGIATGY